MTDEMNTPSPEVRRKSFYTPDRREDSRLGIQNRLLNGFDADIYAEVFAGVPGPLAVLDVGCGTGDMILPKLGGTHNATFLGIDRSAQQIQTARAKPLPEGYSFACMDVEAEDFETQLRKEMDARHIAQFNVISLSMVLLHLADPLRVLTLLRAALAKGGRIIVRDIDDGLNFAAPDPTGCFARLFRMGLEDEYAGNRFTGRNVYSWLTLAGFQNVELRRQGLSTAGLDPEQKEAYYDMSFALLLRLVEDEAARHPDCLSLQRDLDWAHACGSEVHDRFMAKDFIASLGFMTFTATAE